MGDSALKCGGYGEGNYTVPKPLSSWGLARWSTPPLNNGPDNENISYCPLVPCSSPAEVRVFQPVGKLVGLPYENPLSLKGLSYRACPL